MDCPPAAFGNWRCSPFDTVDEYGRNQIGLLHWALVFLVVALIAAALGFTGIAAAATGIVKILFFISLIIFVILPLIGLLGRRPPRIP